MSLTKPKVDPATGQNQKTSAKDDKFFDYLILCLRSFVTVFIFWIIFANFEWQRLRMILTQADLRVYGIAIMVGISYTIVAAAALKRILKSVHVKATLWSVLRINYLSHFFSFLGVWAGSIVRWHGLAGQDRRRGEAFFSILMERLQMTFVFSIIFIMTLFIGEYQYLRSSERIIFGVFGLVLAIIIFSFFLILFNTSITGRIQNYLDGWNPRSKVLNQCCQKADDFVRVWNHCQGQKGHIISSLYYWVLHSILVILVFGLVCAAVDIHLSIMTIAWICSFNALAQMIPITVFGLGIREGILIYFLPRYGIGVEEALAAGFLLFMFAILYSGLGGLYYTWDQLLGKKRGISR